MLYLENGRVTSTRSLDEDGKHIVCNVVVESSLPGCLRGLSAFSLDDGRRRLASNVIAEFNAGDSNYFRHGMRRSTCKRDHGNDI